MLLKSKVKLYEVKYITSDEYVYNKLERLIPFQFKWSSKRLCFNFPNIFNIDYIG